MIVDCKCKPCENYNELFSYLITILEQPNTRNCISGLKAYDACVSQLHNDDLFVSGNNDSLINLYRLTHQFIGALAESRCFASFSFLQALFGRVSKRNTIDILRTIGGYFMDTHNKCWGAWATIGKDHHCQPELYLGNFCKRETREKVIEYINLFAENDKKVIGLLKEITAIE